MTENLLYELPEVVLFFALLVALAAVVELGFRLGRRREASATETERTQFSNIQSALLGLFALILGFTFSMALSRYEHRKEMVVLEANVIGTATLRTEFLGATERAEARAKFRRYIEVRLGAATLPNVASDERKAFDEEASALQADIWRAAVASANEDPRSVPRGLFVQAVNELIDTKEARDASLANQVPTAVLVLLLAFAVIVVGVVGYGGGLAGSRPLGAWIALVVLTTGVMILVVDLDRPQRGLVRVNQRSLENVQRDLAREP